VQRDYRGHLIRLIETEGWSAELVELDTGALLPTTVSATESEGVEVCAARAESLIDLYLEAQEQLDRRRRAEPTVTLRLVR
jgi:hypothetical protein